MPIGELRPCWVGAGLSSNIHADGCSPPGSQGHSSSAGVAGAGLECIYLVDNWVMVVLIAEGKLKVDQIP